MNRAASSKLIQRLTALLCLAVACTAVQAQNDNLKPKRQHDLEPDDYFSIGTITNVAVAPDGRHVAYAELRWDKELDGRNSDLWLLDTRAPGAKPRRLTFDQADDSHPHWSPDGRFIYFASARQLADEKAPLDGTQQVWRVTPAGGPPQAVTRVPGGIQQAELSHDGQSLYYVKSEEQIEDEFKELRTTYKELEYGHGVENFSQVWKLDLQSWRAEKLIDEKRVIRDLSISPNERYIAMITTPDSKLISNEGWSRIDIYDAKDKSITSVEDHLWREDAPSPHGWLDAVVWSPDGQALAHSVSWDGYQPELFVTEMRGGQFVARKVMRPAMHSITGGAFKWLPDSRNLAYLAEEKARARVYLVKDLDAGTQGDTVTLTPGDVAVTAFDFAERSGELYAALSTTTHMRDVYHFPSPDKQARRLTNVNPQVDTWKLPQISIVQWAGANGDPVEGILELPPDYQPGDGPLPMVVEIHGGPTASTLYRLRFWIYGRALLPAKGYAVLSPNYRGSTGYGDKFMTDLIGHENDIEVTDIRMGIAAMINRGIADPNKLGVMGWSNGGFLTNCLITRDIPFKAASSGAGIFDMVIQWGSEDTPGHVINYMESNLPWQNADKYVASSPGYHAGNINTPTLIHVGAQDRRVPPAHSKALYRALRRYLHVPTNLVMYPGEGHGLTTYTHRKAKMEWDLAWFDKYILEKDQAVEKEE